MEIGSINAGFVNAVSDNAKAASNDITNKLKKDMSNAEYDDVPEDSEHLWMSARSSRHILSSRSLRT